MDPARRPINRAKSFHRCDRLHSARRRVPATMRRQQGSKAMTTKGFLSRAAILTMTALTLAACQGEAAATQAAAPGASLTRAAETRDFGVAPTQVLRASNRHANTPRTVPGARTITTQELADLLTLPQPPVLLDVLGGSGHSTVSGAQWMPGAGDGSTFDDEVQTRLVAAATRLANGDKGRTVVVFCLSELCWLSYNAALRLVHAGFTNVRWYRGGTEAWAAARQPTVRATRATW
jgi:PQQ-dependent catabolism-associated CXXCW motif protein